MLTKSYDQSTAKEIADSHEVNPDAIASEDAATKQFDTLEEADQSIDLRNNIIGRAVGEANRNVVGGPHQLAEALVQEFHEKGLWVAVQQANGKYKAARVKLTDAEFAAASQKLTGLDDRGLTAPEAQQRKKAIDKQLTVRAERKLNEFFGGLKLEHQATLRCSMSCNRGQNTNTKDSKQQW